MALVVAHADDEVLGLGSRVALFRRLALIHLTDGAPEDPAFAQRAGFAARGAYAQARAAELDAALQGLGVRPARRLGYGWPDQGLVERLPELIARLVGDLAGQTAVFTHAYEGGHPDHDAAALGVAAACARLGEAAPARFEFAGYFGCDGVLQANAFHADPARPETCVRLSAAERAAKAAAFAAHASQSEVLANFPPGVERWRPAPDYDFTRPPPSGEPLYDGYGWPLTSRTWRERAAAALAGG